MVNEVKHPDELMKVIFSSYPYQEPHPDFTVRVMSRLPEGFIVRPQQSAESYNIGFRTLIAMLLTAAFFALVLLTSDLGFTQWIYSLTGKMFTDFSLSALFETVSSALFGFFNLRLLSIIAGLVFLMGGGLMVAEYVFQRYKNIKNAGFLIIFW